MERRNPYDGGVEHIDSIGDDDDLIWWFYRCLEAQNKMYAENWSPFGTYYEFGVGWEATLNRYMRAVNKFCEKKRLNRKDFKIVCFDSFKGLPAPKHDADKHLFMWEGAFAHAKDETIKEIERWNLGEFNIKFVEGFFDESLTKELQNKMSQYPPAIVTIDVDYYSSTEQVLNWLSPMLKSGTFFYFDDIWSFHGNPNYGELKAINEYNVSGKGFFTLYPLFGKETNSYIYSRKIFEY